MTSQPVELVPDALYAVGDAAPNDGRLSWASPGTSAFEPVNSFLLVEDGHALLIDPGVAAHESTMLGQLGEILGPETKLSVFCTRFEGDCVTALGPVIRDFNVVSIFGGGVSNPFDFFEDVSPQEQIRTDHHIEILRKKAGDTIEVGPGRSVDLLSTSLRVLTTFWLYDERTGTLFTSDFFAYEGLDHADRSDLVRHTTPDTFDRSAAARRLFTKIDWLLLADPAPFVEELDRLFDTYDIRAIAPGHGRIIVGRETVRSYYELTRELLLTCGRAHSTGEVPVHG
ncbi:MULTISPECIES: oxygen-binding di-iron domain-containing protein [Rhodococcus]|uniref:ODP domain-containing protein n=1 Tax=Rhodococcus chondri TaxID=3065941 RepID=A0ABU7JN60_9NOCA|nr:hypothetical protein [Rhodococcus sp. CC-R104]MEE2031466.1 hypothetical protein [Rhodococcus sp. CC-R104]